jgi:Zn-dependent M28 family amino/carboxypeptidase
MKLWDKRALKRLGWLFAAIVVIVVVCWFAMIRMPLRSHSGPLPPLSPEQAALRDELKTHVTKLAGELGERNVYTPRTYAAAANYIEQTLTHSSLRVTRQCFVAMGERCDNLIVEIPGTTRAKEIIVVGAHYDSVQGVLGANDNASGAAATLSLARQFSGGNSARTLRFVLFANEEPPFFQTELMGSLVYARSCRASNDNIVAMLSLETIGCYSDAENSQRYPFPVGLFYPGRGNFVAFVGKTTQAGLVRRCVRSFRTQTPFPSEGAALPSKIPGVDWSDHWAFWQVDYPAMQVSDTAIFRYRQYHTTEDTPDKLDYERMARVVDGLEKVIRDLADAE